MAMVTLTFQTVNLTELDQPHKLSQWIMHLPSSKPTKDQIDTNICNDLSSFIYSEQIDGLILKNDDFTKADLVSMIQIVNIDANGKYQNYNSDWIWKRIEIAKNPIATCTDSKNSKLIWINSQWSKYQWIKMKTYSNYNDIGNIPIDKSKVLSNTRKKQAVNATPSCLNLFKQVLVHNPVIGDDDGRLLWEVGSLVLIFSRSKQDWYHGEIITIGQESLTVRYDGKHKDMQLYCKHIKPYPSTSLQVGSECIIHSDDIWFVGTILDKFTDKEGEWLRVKYTDLKKQNKICEIQRYSEHLRCFT